jgi:hypothetical protein
MENGTFFLPAPRTRSKEEKKGEAPMPPTPMEQSSDCKNPVTQNLRHTFTESRSAESRQTNVSVTADDFQKAIGSNMLADFPALHPPIVAVIGE